MTIDTSKLKRYKPGYVHSNDGPAYLSMLSRADGEYVRLDDVMALAALSSHRQAGDDRPHVVRIPKEKRWVEGDSEFLKWHADGYNSALSDVMSVNQGVSRLEPSEHPSQDALRKLLPDLIDYAESGKVAEPWMVGKMRAELESLLALVEKGAGNG